jgi:hypothetical protein
MDVWFCVTRRNRAERLNRGGDEQAEGRTRRSPERIRRSSLNLTKTYHGSRQIGHMAVAPCRFSEKPAVMGIHRLVSSVRDSEV